MERKKERNQLPQVILMLIMSTWCVRRAEKKQRIDTIAKETDRRKTKEEEITRRERERERAK